MGELYQDLGLQNPILLLEFEEWDPTSLQNLKIQKKIMFDLFDPPPLPPVKKKR